MICVTGASGTLSSEVIRQLKGQAIPFRAAYFSERAAEIARARGIEAVTIDYNHPHTLRAAFDACDTLFLLGPNALNQTELELNAVEAAKAAGVRYIVKQSVMGAAEEAYSLAKIHRAVEKAIETSGLAWTFLRPNSFMRPRSRAHLTQFLHNSQIHFFACVPMFLGTLRSSERRSGVVTRTSIDKPLSKGNTHR